MDAAFEPWVHAALINESYILVSQNTPAFEN